MALWEGYRHDVFQILHSKAFSRYADKTQVVYLFDHDHITHNYVMERLGDGFWLSYGKTRYSDESPEVRYCLLHWGPKPKE